MIRDGWPLPLALDELAPRITDKKERAFVQALSYGTLRWYFRLDGILDQLANKPLKAKDVDVRILALLGLFQIAFTRVKPHAAVAETVAAAGRKRWAKPLLNALLRRYLRERNQIDARADAADSGRSGHPEWLAAVIRTDWPAQTEAILAANNRVPPMALRVNRLKSSRDDYLAVLARHGIEAAASTVNESAVILADPVDVEQLPGFARGVVSVQDTAAQLAAPLLEVKEGHRVLDVCAAPGGKTLHILETCPGLADMVAVDVAPDRAARIGENLRRSGLDATVLTADASMPKHWWNGRHFDRLMVDAPCSATGVIRRHPDIRLLRQPEDVTGLQERQRAILQAAWCMLAPGGVLLYATCSVLRCENEYQIQWFLDGHPDAREWPINARWGTATRCGRQILTGEQDMDGFYYARLLKAG